MLGDLRLALRSLLRRPGFTLVAVLTLALGTGTTTAIFSVVDGVLLRPLPYGEGLVVTHGSYPDLRDVGGLAISASNMYEATTPGGDEHLRGDQVTPDYFAVAGLQPALGRGLTEADGAARLAVLSYGLWQRRYGGDPAAVGRTITLNGRPHTIVGVMPRRFHLPDAATALWVSLASGLAEVPEQAANRNFRIFTGLGRATQASVDVVAARLARDFPDTDRDVRFRLRPLRDGVIGDVQPALLVLLGTVALVLLIACANVAHLMLARTAARERELAVRRALGAGRWRLARQLFAEAVLLALVGGALGVMVALWG